MLIAKAKILDRHWPIYGSLIVLLLINYALSIFYFYDEFQDFINRLRGGDEVSPASVNKSYYYKFSVPGVTQERQLINQSRSQYWWVNSGGELIVRDGIGSTFTGELPKFDRWRLIYADSNPIDTDNGYHPQNIFRLVSRQQWKDYSQQVYFRVLKDNLSQSPNRNGSNGFFLFNRYQDGNNLYYVGLRVDGSLVIKKKLRGTYYTLAQQKILGGSYDRSSNPNLLPKWHWMGLRTDLVTQANGSLLIRAYVDSNNDGFWEKVTEAIDSGREYGPIISQKGYTGIRSDFMDVEFAEYRVVGY